MVLDDDEDTVIALKLVLEYAGFYIQAFTDPFMVLSSFQANVYDLILLDIVMPNLNGIHISEKIKRLDKTIKICFLTANWTYYKKVKEEKFFDIPQELLILKPVENSVLIDKINNILFAHMIREN